MFLEKIITDERGIKMGKAFVKSATPREIKTEENLRKTVSSIIQDVIQNKDQAVLKYNQKFDNNSREMFRVTKEEIQNAYKKVSASLIEDMKVAHQNIEKFAKAQLETINQPLETEVIPGAFLGHKKIPVESVCCYVPGGYYPLFSTALMLATPAKVAGVKRIIACSPPANGTTSIHPSTLVALDLAGVDEIYTVGGVQAVAAATYGTEQIKNTALIVGPGNQYVTEAKRQCYGKIGIDFIAGPSEVLILADETANPKFLAADLLAQSEHDKNAKGILITPHRETAENTVQEIKTILQTLSTKEIAEVSWEKNGEIIVVDTIEEGIILTNEIAPEHLEIIVKDSIENHVIEQLTNYGALFIGGLSAEVFGDYVSGTNHTLPTIGAPRYTGGLWVGTFIKTCTYQKFTPEGIHALAPIAERMGYAEGLHAHALAARARFNE